MSCLLWTFSPRAAARVANALSRAASSLLNLPDPERARYVVPRYQAVSLLQSLSHAVRNNKTVVMESNPSGHLYLVTTPVTKVCKKNR